MAMKAKPSDKVSPEVGTRLSWILTEYDGRIDDTITMVDKKDQFIYYLLYDMPKSGRIFILRFIIIRHAQIGANLHCTVYNLLSIHVYTV